MIRRLTLPVCLALTLCAAVLAGCGDGATPATAAASMDRHDAGGTMHAAVTRTRHEPVARGIRVTVVRSRYGRIVADGRGQAFYFFERETGATPRCYGRCAKAWPPVYATGMSRTGVGADAGAVGVTRRRDGRRQLTYAGRPVYYYVGDAPGRVLCHDVTEFGGRWVVIRPDGTPVP